LNKSVNVQGYLLDVILMFLLPFWPPRAHRADLCWPKNLKTEIFGGSCYITDCFYYCPYILFIDLVVNNVQTAAPPVFSSAPHKAGVGARVDEQERRVEDI
jgi:hypothetical protein